MLVSQGVRSVITLVCCPTDHARDGNRVSFKRSKCVTDEVPEDVSVITRDVVVVQSSLQHRGGTNDYTNARIEIGVVVSLNAVGRIPVVRSVAHRQGPTLSSRV